VVYLLSSWKRHVDHRAANDVMLAASAGSALKFECRGYEVWTPLLANCLVKIDDVIDVKKSAMACYRSQAGADGLSAFRLGLECLSSIGVG